MSLATSNIFAALDTKKKKKSGKASQDTSDKKKKAPKPERLLPTQQHIFSGQAKPAVSNWADTDEEDDFNDDIGPLPESWLQSGAPGGEAREGDEEDATDSEGEAHVEEIHEALGLEVTKDEEEEEEEEEEKDGAADWTKEVAPASEEPQQHAETAAPAPEKQLSKKEQKRLELEDMNRVLAELGIEPAPGTKAEAQTSGQGAIVEESEANGVEAGAAKKKKKKDKKKGEGGEAMAPPETPAPPEAPPQDSNAEAAAVIDPAEAKKLLAKKKAAQTKKGGPSSAGLAAKEAKERAAKKSKVKDKKNYNQAPTR